MGFMQIVTRALRGTPMGQQLVAEARKAASVTRAEMAAKLQRAQAEAEAALPPVLQAEEAAQERVAAARDVVVAAERELLDATLKRWSATHGHEHRIGALERELAALAPPEIDAFHAYCSAVLAAVAALHEQWGPARPARVRVVNRVSQARGEAEALRLTGLSDPEIVAALDSLRAEIVRAAEGCGHELLAGIQANVDDYARRRAEEARRVGSEAA